MRKARNKGFIKYVIIIVIAICLLAYFNVSAREALNWFIEAVKKVFNI